MMKWFSFVSKRSKVTVTSNIQQKYSGQYSAPQFRSSDLAGVCVSVCVEAYNHKAVIFCEVLSKCVGSLIINYFS